MFETSQGKEAVGRCAKYQLKTASPEIKRISGDAVCLGKAGSGNSCPALLPLLTLLLFRDIFIVLIVVN